VVTVPQETSCRFGSAGPDREGRSTGHGLTACAGSEPKPAITVVVGGCHPSRTDGRVPQHVLDGGSRGLRPNATTTKNPPYDAFGFNESNTVDLAARARPGRVDGLWVAEHLIRPFRFPELLQHAGQQRG